MLNIINARIYCEYVIYPESRDSLYQRFFLEFPPLTFAIPVVILIKKLYSAQYIHVKYFEIFLIELIKRWQLKVRFITYVQLPAVLTLNLFESYVNSTKFKLQQSI